MAYIKVIQLRGLSRRSGAQRLALLGLGLKGINRVAYLEDSPAVRGLIERVHHLVRAEVFSGDLVTAKR